MEEPNTPPADTQGDLEGGGLVLSSTGETGLTLAAAEAEMAQMRQMMEVLFARVESMQQNQVIQFSGVNDRLDAVELELPLIQEKSALRMRDLENRVNEGMEDAARTIAEQVAADLQGEVSDKFGSLAAQIESQRVELAEMRESRMLTETRLTKALESIERLCGTLAPASFPVQVPAEAHRASPEAPVSARRSRIAEHIRKAAVEAAPDESNPLVAETPVRRPIPEPSAGAPDAPVSEPVKTDAPASKPEVSPALEPRQGAVCQSAHAETPAFDDWKRRFMQSGQPLIPTLGTELGTKGPSVVCPRCYSVRTRAATPTRMDGILRLAGLHPHRCRACGYRFHKRGVAGIVVDSENSDSRTEEALDAR